MAGLDSLVVQDLFLNETAREYATVFLPAASAFEKDGTFMNSERRVQRVRAAIDPPGDARADWEIFCLLAAELGCGAQFTYAGPSAIWEEIRAVWEPGAGMTYERLNHPGGLQWPCPSEDDPGTTILHREQFGPSVGARASLRRIDALPAAEPTTDDFPLLLVTGRSLYQFNAGTMTGRSVTRRLRPTDLLEIHPEDAAMLGVADGDLVEAQSRYGAATLPVEVTDQVAPSTVFATFNDPRTRVNQLTGPHRDTHTNTPEYKVTAVRLVPAVASASGERR